VTAVLATLALLGPVLVHSSNEPSPVSSAGAFAGTVPGVPPGGGPVAYERRAGAWTQWWLLFPRNAHDRGIVRTGRHAGDWEMVQVRVDGAGRPVEAVYGQHSGAERCPWSAVERRGGRPVVFLARGSHAAYFRPGVRDRMWPDPNDEADGRGAVVTPAVERVSAREPAWMRWPGRWGGARAGWVPGEESSPRGPAFQPQGRWSDPDGWARQARPCTFGRCDERGECDGVETAMMGGAVGAVAVGGVFVWRRGRRRRGASGESELRL
jgi:Vacuolar protein sorting-associated protein 62